MIPLIALASAGEPVTVQVAFSGLRNDTGQLVVMLYCDDEGFPKKPEKACHTQTASIAAGAASVTFDQLPRGTYALSAVHDEDGDGALDTFLGIPSEGVGMIGSSSGMPSFEDASFLVDGDKSLSGTMVYIL